MNLSIITTPISTPTTTPGARMITLIKPFYSVASVAGMLLALCPLATLAQSSPGIKVIDPDKKVPTANAAALDTEHFEVGFYTGLLSVEDFNTNPVFGAALRYYVSEKFFIEGNVGSSSTRRANAEGDLDFNPERDMTYLGMIAGYQVLKGRSFWGKKRKYNTGFYLLGGVEQVDFAEDSNVGGVIGISYKTILTDWLTINLDFKDHFVNRNFLDEEKMTHNTEITFGINTIF